MMDLTKSPAWDGFRSGEWRHLINVRNFIQKNYTPYEGDDAFLTGTTARTDRVWEKCRALIVEEVKKGIIDVETHIVSGIDNFEPGYIDKKTRSLSVCKLMHHSSALSIFMVACAWPRQRWNSMAIP